jgi:citrate/tricarballylate utilization protein
MHGTRILDEADRLMTVCNSAATARAVRGISAMEMRPLLLRRRPQLFANLCHACGACYVDCQFSPPHEFNVNVPQTLAIARAESYAAYAWPRAFAGCLRAMGLSSA